VPLSRSSVGVVLGVPWWRERDDVEWEEIRRNMVRVKEAQKSGRGVTKGERRDRGGDGFVEWHQE
jgi:hypothetical protein